MVISEYVVQVKQRTAAGFLKRSELLFKWISLAKWECSILKVLFVLGLPPADLGGADELADLENGRGLLHLCSHTSGQYNINQSRMQHHIGLLHGLFWRALFVFFLIAPVIMNSSPSFLWSI